MAGALGGKLWHIASGKWKGDVTAREGKDASRPEILVVAPNLVPMKVTDRLEAAGFTPHLLWKQPDPGAFLDEHGVHLKGVVTDGSVGADERLMELLPNLSIIACFAVGVDAVDLRAAKEKGITVTYTPDVLTDDVADMALGLLLATARGLCQGDRHVRQGKWPQGNTPLGQKIGGKRLGIIGLGRIGKAIAKRGEAFGLQVSYTSRSKKEGVGYKYFEDVVQLAKESDFLVISCPGGPSTHHLVGREVLEALGPKGTLINIARGPVVDEPELVSALVEGRLGYAGLDVFESEPEVPMELWSMDNVVLQPHNGSATEETRAAMADLVLDNLKAHFEGRGAVTPIAL